MRNYTNHWRARVGRFFRSRRGISRSQHRLSKAILEALETRTLLSTYIVNTLVDNGSSGTCLTGPLRWAIEQADGAGGDQTITFDPSLTVEGPATITLNGTALTLDDTSGTLTIQGPGANLLTIDAGGGGGIFDVEYNSKAEIDGLVITGASRGLSPIENDGTLTLSDSTISGNHDNYVSGIYNQGTLYVVDSTISGNWGEVGGGILNYGYSTATVTDSTISDNSTLLNGGGISNWYSTLTIVDSTISGNYSTNGGGIYNQGPGAVTVINSTISGNQAQENGGGIYNNGPLTLTDCTVSGNAIQPGGSGGGITGGGALYGTIVANSSGGSDLSGSFTGNYNLIGDTSGTLGGLTNTSTNPNLLDTNPDLSALGNYGGPTETMALLPGSPAIDHGGYFNDANGNAIEFDQRGISRLQGNGPDIGAYESQGAPDAPSDVLATVSKPDEIDLSWNDCSTNASGFTVWVSTTGSGGTFTNLTTTPIEGFTYSAVDLTADQTYTFEIKAESIDGESAASSPVSAMAISSTLAATGAATVAEGGSYTLSVSSTPSDDLSWPIDHWLINWNDGITESIPNTNAVNTTSHTFANGISTGIVTIIAVDNHGNTFSQPPVTVTILPIEPVDFHADIVSSTEIDFSWVNPGYSQDAFDLEWSTDGINFQTLDNSEGNDTTYDATNLTPGTNYTFEVAATSDVGESNFAITTATTLPAAPTGLSAQVTASDEVDLEWNAVSGNTGYEIDRSSDGNSWTDVSSSISATQYSDTPPSINTWYYRVGATSNSGNLDFSDSIKVDMVPDAPTGLTVTQMSPSEIDLTWSEDSASVTGFDIERSADSINFSQIGTATDDSYQDTTVTGDTPMTYEIIAYNDAGSSASSETASTLLGPAGTVDSTFGQSGTATLNYSYGGIEDSNPADASALTSDGKLIVPVRNGPNGSVGLVELNSDGTINSSFGNNGFVVVAPNYSPFGDTATYTGPIYGIATETPSGNILVAENPSYGSYYGSFGSQWALVCYSANGTINSSFGTDGVVLIDPSQNQSVYSPFGNLYGLTEQPNGDILLYGYTSVSAPVGDNDATQNYPVAIVRLLPDGARDPNFGENGEVILNESNPDDYYYYEWPASIALAPDGRIGITMGGTDLYYTNYSTHTSSRQGFRAIVELDSSGTLVPDFGDDGVVKVSDTSAGAINGINFADTFLPDDDIVVDASDEQMIQYYSTNGSLDNEIGVDGEVANPVGYGFYGFSLASEGDGDVLLAQPGISACTMTITRLDSQGTVDATFGNDGSIEMQYSDPYESWAPPLIFLPDGRVVSIVVGDAQNSPNQLFITRYLPDPVSLTAHRTGDNLGEAVSDSVKESGDPSQYVVLVDDDYQIDPTDTTPDDGYPTAALSNDQPTTDANGDPIDTDLAQITLDQLPAWMTSGTVSITLSDPSAVRLFTGNGIQLSASDMTLDPSDPAGYLAGLMNGNVDVWVQAIKADPNFVFKIGYTDSNGNEISRDTVHMLLADWQFVDDNGNDVTSIQNFPDDYLIDGENGDPIASELDSSSEYKVEIDGLPSQDLQTLKIASDADPDDWYDASFGSDASSVETSNYNVLYFTPDTGGTLTQAQETELDQTLQLDGVHNPIGDVTATTQGGDQFTRKLTTKPWTVADYQNTALKRAGIDPNTWDPSEGFGASIEPGNPGQYAIVEKVYNYYQTLYKQNNNLQWAGMARMAGGSVVRGLVTMVDARLQLAVGAAFLQTHGINEASVQGWINLGVQTEETVETILLQAQKNIFNDLAWQHEAYIAGGIQEMTRLHNDHDLTDDAYQAWLDIDSGIQQNNQALIWKGNVELLKREQQTVLGPSYAQLAAIPGVASVMSKQVQNPYPGGGPFPATGDVTNFDQRWAWLTTQAVPVWQNLTQAQRDTLVGESYLALTGI